MTPSINPNLILGLDLGANSLGWVLLDAPDGKPESVRDAGVRVFEAGVNLLEKGEKASRSLDRRQARGRRRLLDRGARRRRKLLHALQRAGLLPAGELHGHLRPNDPANPVSLVFLDTAADPYHLRAQALQRKLELFELGRALYHLARRRGFLSNRKVPRKEEEKEGVVDKETRALEAEMKAAGFRTIGALLASLDPHEARRRGRYTLRKWFEDEFEAIWAAQQPHHPETLTQALKKSFFKIIFHQRPLKSQTRLIGVCELEKRPVSVVKKLKNGQDRRMTVYAGPKRAPMAALPAQRARMLQTLNDLRVVEYGAERPLKPEERSRILDALDRADELKLTTLRSKTLLNLPRFAKFNFEAGERETIPGNDTAAQLRKAFGEKWDAMTPDQRNLIVSDLLSIQKDETFVKRAAIYSGKYSLTDEQRKALDKFTPEDGYHRLSLRALKKILPHLESGLSYSEARQHAYPGCAAPDALDSLPAAAPLRNPIVQRALAELRRVVNAIIRKYGKPGTIRIELARELKKTQKQRDEIGKQNAKNRKARDKAREAVVRETGQPNPTSYPIEKYLLWEECGGICPYTGKSIPLSGEQGLFGGHPAFDIEHIIPLTRSLDNSFFNKTLCCVNFNRNIKRNRTPWEAVGEAAQAGDPAMKQQWANMIDSVKRFKSDKDMRDAKLERFKFKTVPGEESFLEEFSTRQLNDTRYASRQAREYLGLLYGAEAVKRVQPLTGQVTAYLRSAWKLNGILSGDGGKSREDHRHHAVDALCAALTTRAVVHQLHTAAGRGVNVFRPGTFPAMEEPWSGFIEHARRAVTDIMVSHRVSRKVSGPIHQETLYGEITRPDTAATQKPERAAVLRTPLIKLDEKDLDDIVDETVRKTVKDHLAKLAADHGIDITKAVKLLENEDNLPFLTAKDGRRIPIRKVRVFVRAKPFSIAGGDHQRLVISGNNHHLAVYEGRNKKGETIWQEEVVSLKTAMERARKHEPVVAPKDKDGNKLLFSLVIGDAVEMEIEGEKSIWIVRSISERDFRFKPPHDARLAKDLNKEKSWRICSIGSLQSGKCRKIHLSPLGEVSSAK